MAKILLLEDDQGARQALNTFFDVMGHRVVATATGAEALLEAARDPPDILISDWLLGDEALDGVQVANTLRQQIPGLWIIFVTGYPVGELRNLCRAMAVHTFMAKPVSLHELNSAVNEILKQGKLH